MKKNCKEGFIREINIMENTRLLSPYELAMYMAWQDEPDSCEYILDYMFEIKGAGKREISDAVSCLIKRQDALRSCFGVRDGHPVRIITDDVPGIRWVDCPDVSKAREMIRDSEQPLSLSCVPLRFTGYCLSDGSILLSLKIHHIIFDGVSISIMAEELFSSLTGKKLKEMADRPGRDEGWVKKNHENDPTRPRRVWKKHVNV